MTRPFDRERYDRALAEGAEEYRDVLDALKTIGIDAQFTQTGGMCAAIEANLEDATSLLITDADDSLSWDRGHHNGWGVGVYEIDAPDEPIWFDTVDDGSLQALIDLVDRACRR
ncbi:hypothetical protein QSJ18_19765 [Gordonia sp. ABSL1-1]|uniref:hypothetical protein n=1 Tax=Gordonia sp. ABSL1-1 TaxID=3053923 RepID=UPI002573D15E|nr:hypothetical protein [Gordonia sp. ABSL1-1]MDL9938989.1 hypothetical protein [Gordonia sp. ABSL1-1]